MVEYLPGWGHRAADLRRHPMRIEASIDDERLNSLKQLLSGHIERLFFHCLSVVAATASLIGLTVVAVVLTAAGLVGFRRRDMG